jgi:hypothetical protein
VFVIEMGMAEGPVTGRRRSTALPSRIGDRAVVTVDAAVAPGGRAVPAQPAGARETVSPAGRRVS